MGQQLILSEEEKRNIQEMYGLINEQDSSELPTLEDIESSLKEIFGDDLGYSDLDYGYDENPLKMGVKIDGKEVISIDAGNYCDNKKGIEVTLFYERDGNSVRNTMCSTTLEGIKERVFDVYNGICEK